MNTSVLPWIFVVILGAVALLLWRLQRTQYAPHTWEIDLDSPLHLAAAPEVGADVVQNVGPPVRVSLSGTIPKKMYLDSSAIVALEGSAQPQANVHVVIPVNARVRLQLLAPGFAVDGERSQERHIPCSTAQLSFRWGIRPLVTGRHELAITTFLLGEQGEEADIDYTVHIIRVVEFLGMTGRYLRWFYIGAAILSLVIAAISAYGSLR